MAVQTGQTGKPKVTVAEFGRNVCGSLMGVDLACVLTIVAASMTGPLATKALFLFLGSLALLAPHTFISHVEAWNKQSVSKVMEWMHFCGGIFSVLGVCVLVESHTQGAGWFLGVFGFLSFYVFVQSSERWKRQAERPNNTSSNGVPPVSKVSVET